MPKKGTAREVWSKVFGIEPTDPKLLLEHYTALLQEVDRTISVFENRPDPLQELYLSALATVRRALGNINFEASWETVLAGFNDSAMVGLRFCVAAFSAFDNEQKILKEELHSLREDLDKFVKSVVDADVDVQFKRELLSALEAIRRAILEYAVGGADGLQRAADALYGTIVRHRDAKKPDEKSAIESALKVVETLDKLIIFARNVKGFLKPAIRLLIGDGTSSPVDVEPIDTNLT